MTSIKIEPLGRENYDTWIIQVEALLRKNKRWNQVLGKVTKPAVDLTNVETIQAAEKWEDEDQEAKSDLILTMSPSELKHIKHCTTANEVWLKLKQVHQSSGPARKATLLKQLIMSKMQEGQDVREHLTHFMDAVDKLLDMGVEIHKDLLTIMMLYSLHKTYENFRVAIESRDELPTPEALRIKIIEESEARKQNHNGNGEQSDAMMTNKFQGKHKKWKSQPNEFKFMCRICKRKGHKAADCPNKKKCHQQQNQQQAGAATALITGKTENKWCLDSGCSIHMCKDKKMFQRLDESELEGVQLASNDSIPILGQGTVALNALNDHGVRKLALEETLFVPDLRINLMSVGKIVDKGFTVTFEKRGATAYAENGEILLTADRIGDLFYLRKPSHETACAKYENENERSLDLWHRRLGHLNEHDLKEMAKGGVIGMEIPEKAKLSACKICLQGKLTQTPFPKKSERKTEVLDIVHTDICGPMRVTSIGGSHYFITFIDDATRWCEVKFLKHKSEALEAFKNFKNKVEKQTGKKVKCLQSDNGLEYINNSFKKFLDDQGITRRLTVPDTPQQNGVSERKNRTLVEMARCMMIEANIAPGFWAEAINTANYIRNRCKSSSVGGKIPYELWTGRKPIVTYFKTFGCIGYALDKKIGKGKFDPRSKECVFVGYSEETKGFKVWYPKQHKFGVTRDVKFLDEFAVEVGNFEEFFTDEKLKTSPSENQMEIEVELTPMVKKVNENKQFEKSMEFMETQQNMGTTNPECENETESTETRRGGPETRVTSEALEPTQVLRRSERIAKLKLNTCCETEIDMEKAEVELPQLGQVNVDDALSGPNSEEWYEAIETEYRALLKNGVWDLIEKPTDRNTVGNRLILTNKYKKDGTLERRKARLVAKGFTQRPGTDFTETFNPVIRMNSIRTIMAIAAIKGLTLHQMDVTTAYLNGEITEEIVMEIPVMYKKVLERMSRKEPKGSDIHSKVREHLKQLKKGRKVCKIRKALYGLKQSGRMWYFKLDETLKEIGMKPSTADPCVYVGEIEEQFVIIGVYVDDLILATKSPKIMDALKDKLNHKFDMKDLGAIHYCLGIEISHSQKEGEVSMSQKKYINQLLQKFKMEDSKPINTPAEVNLKLKKPEQVSVEDMKKYPYQNLIGSLNYLSTCTRPDISHTISMLSQFNANYSKEHWDAAKRVLRYLKGTIDVALTFRKSGGSDVQGYVDADWGSCVEDRRSYTGYVFTLAGAAVSWESRKQRTVALSSTEAEYMAMTEATKEAICIERLLGDLQYANSGPIMLHSDNNGAKEIAKNPVHHARTKHIDIRHHFVREALAGGKIELKYLPTERMIADVLTKPLPGPRHSTMRASLGLKPQA